MCSSTARSSGFSPASSRCLPRMSPPIHSRHDAVPPEVTTLTPPLPARGLQVNLGGPTLPMFERDEMRRGDVIERVIHLRQAVVEDLRLPHRQACDHIPIEGESPLNGDLVHEGGVEAGVGEEPLNLP